MSRYLAVLALLSLLVAVAGAGFASAPALAQDLSKGRAAFESGDYATALKEFTPLAEQGNPVAQFVLSVIYATGRGVAQDYEKAEKWTRKAAEQGYIKAVFNLGLMHARGWGVTQDDTEAVKWYKKAAETGLPEAQFNLGAAYAEGRGAPEDHVRAYMWLSLAAAQSYQLAVPARTLLVKKMSEDEIAKAQDRSHKCLAQNFKNC